MSTEMKREGESLTQKGAKSTFKVLEEREREKITKYPINWVLEKKFGGLCLRTRENRIEFKCGSGIINGFPFDAL